MRKIVEEDEELGQEKQTTKRKITGHSSHSDPDN